ncbi:hypothetical protein L3X38_008755 [Prunus dulcis]|uniref:Uncharacterized protein n=1 Tax=Prunus dulcis TaxID=3755 RepID=A0AAD4ZX20_PRUDU|nr:hypothetical protein L3X38_008755 [Prunus dulcis]
MPRLLRSTEGNVRRFVHHHFDQQRGFLISPSQDISGSSRTPAIGSNYLLRFQSVSVSLSRQLLHMYSDEGRATLCSSLEGKKLPFQREERISLQLHWLFVPSSWFFEGQDEEEDDAENLTYGSKCVSELVIYQMCITQCSPTPSSTSGNNSISKAPRMEMLGT